MICEYRGVKYRVRKALLLNKYDFKLREYYYVEYQKSFWIFKWWYALNYWAWSVDHSRYDDRDFVSREQAIKDFSNMIDLKIKTQELRQKVKDHGIQIVSCECHDNDFSEVE